MTFIDLVDREPCQQPFVPPGLVYPYSCAAPMGRDHEHVHFAQTCAWPRQPELPREDYSDWAWLAAVPECAS